MNCEAPIIRARTARDWKRVLSAYRTPDRLRSSLELAGTLGLFVALWIGAWLALPVSYALSLALMLPAAGCVVRLFIIQHDCGHGAFFGTRKIDDWTGRLIGILTLTPYDVWRHQHSIHHSSSGHLGKRGTGDISTLTVQEYQALSPLRRLRYRLYRNPLVLFGFGPAVLFIIHHRLPLGLMDKGPRWWISAMATNAAILLVAGLIIWAVGLTSFLIVQLPITIMAASAGVWLFYVQHQFEDTYWAADGSWDLQDAALYGSSHYRLPAVLAWFTGNIGIHHVHHLYSSIPHYRLPQVLRDHPELGEIRPLTMWQSLSCINLTLWDEDRRRLVSFREAAAAT